MDAMKLILVVAAVTLPLASVAQTTTQTAEQTQGKSRDQVKHELRQAQHEGTVPTSNTQYPNTKQMIANNKSKHAIGTHQGETSPNFDSHDTPAAR